MLRNYCNTVLGKKVVSFLKNPWLEKLKFSQAMLLLVIFIIFRIVIVAVSTNIIDPNLTQYKQGGFFLLRKQEVINFVLLSPISLWVYISCWKSAKNFDYYYSFRALLVLFIMGHLSELFIALKEIF